MRYFSCLWFPLPTMVCLLLQQLALIRYCSPLCSLVCSVCLASVVYSSDLNFWLYFFRGIWYTSVKHLPNSSFFLFGSDQIPDFSSRGSCYSSVNICLTRHCVGACQESWWFMEGLRVVRSLICLFPSLMFILFTLFFLVSLSYYLPSSLCLFIFIFKFFTVMDTCLYYK